MVIAFSCPHCGEPYRLKDELAGKKATCKRATCRKIITVPEPGPEPEAPVRRSAEELAAVALADEPKAEAQAVIEIAVVCKHCDFPFTVEPARAGKNVPCPDCTRINRVPIPKIEETGNWRQTGEHLPSLARRDKDPVLEGAWTGGEKGYVAPESLVAAGATAKVEYEPLPLAVKLKRVMLAVGLLGGLVFGVVYLSRARTEGKHEATLEQAIKTVEDGTKRPELHAAIRRLAGETALLECKDAKGRDAALADLRRARSAAVGLPELGYERQLILIETGRSFARAGGNAAQLDAETRMTWSKAQVEIQQTLSKLAPGEVRIWAVRQAARALAESGEGARAVDVAREVVPEADLLEAAGQAGTELLKMGKRDQAEETLRKADALLQAKPNLANNTPAYTALKLAISGQPTLAANAKGVPPPPPSGAVPDASRYAYAEALALLGKQPEALALANRQGSGVSRLRALMLVAAVAAEGPNPADAAAILDGAVALFAAERNPPPTLRLRLAYLLGRVGKVEQANTVAEDQSPVLRAWARLEVMRGRLIANPTQKVADDWLTPLSDPESAPLPQILEREWFARRNSRLGENVRKVVATWPKPAVQPFGEAGVLLGREQRSRDEAAGGE